MEWCSLALPTPHAGWVKMEVEDSYNASSFVLATFMVRSLFNAAAGNSSGAGCGVCGRSHSDRGSVDLQKRALASPVSTASSAPTATLRATTTEPTALSTRTRTRTVTLAATRYGAYASHADGVALRADSSSDTAILGVSTNGFGVEGNTSGADRAALIGRVYNAAGYGVSALNHGSGTEGYLATPTHAGLFRGNVQVTGTIQAGPGATGTPAAYGFVAGNGELNAHSSNVGSVTKLGAGAYEIVINGFPLSPSNTAALVTPYGSTAAYANASFGIGGTLIVYVRGANGTFLDSAFSFVVYKQ